MLLALHTILLVLLLRILMVDAAANTLTDVTAVNDVPVITVAGF